MNDDREQMNRVLLVDDNSNILAAYKRLLQKQFHVETAQSGAEGLEVIDSQEPFAVVVADMRMPGLNGVQFLMEVKRRNPDTVRMILTGNADLQTAIDSVNKGNVFRFLTKPCPQEELIASIRAGMRQYQLITAEQELTSKTLVGSVKVLTEILELANPIAFRRVSHVTNYVKQIASQLRLPNLWQFELAAMLSHIGCITLPSTILEKVYNGESLLFKEHEMYYSHPLIGAKLVSRIPHLEPIARMIQKQHRWYNRYTSLEIAQEGVVSLGAQILKVAIDFDQIRNRDLSSAAALKVLYREAGEYNRNIVKALVASQVNEGQLSDQDLIASEYGVEDIEADWAKHLIGSNALADDVKSRKVLCVDSDPNVLSKYKDRLSKKFQIETAQSGMDGLEMLSSQGPLAVVVGEIDMPDMDGIQFMSKVKEQSPNTVCMIVTGNADLQTVINAVNEGNVFRFLIKPCAPEALGRSLNAALKQHQLLVIESELLNRTLLGSVRIMTQALNLVCPMAFSRSFHITYYVKRIAERLELPDLWQFELAGILSHIGCIVLPSIVLEKLDSERNLSSEERKAYKSHPSIGANLVSRIPLLEQVVAMIQDQQKVFRDYPEIDDTDEEVAASLGAQILKVAIFVDQMLARGYAYEEILPELRMRSSKYSPEVVDALESLNLGSVIDIQSSRQEATDAFTSAETYQTSEQPATTILSQSLGQFLNESLAEFFVDESKEQNIFADSMYDQLGEEGDDEEAEAHGAVAQKDIRTKDGALILAKGEKVSTLLQGILERLEDFIDMEGKEIGDGTLFPAEEREESLFENNIAKRLTRSLKTRDDELEKLEDAKGSASEDLKGHKVVRKDIRIRDGSLLLSKGQRVSPLMEGLLADVVNFFQIGDYDLAEVEEPDHELQKPDQTHAPGYESSSHRSVGVTASVNEKPTARKRGTKGTNENTQLVKLIDFKPGMITAEDISGLDGTLLLARGQKITTLNLRRLLIFHLVMGLNNTEFPVMKSSQM